MNIQLISKNKLKVTLSCEDLKGLGISYDSLDLSLIHIWLTWTLTPRK